MARTSWLTFFAGGLHTGDESITLTGDLSSLMLGDEVTIVKIVGTIQLLIEQATIANSAQGQWGLRVSAHDTFAEEPDPALAGPAEDDDGFWMHKEAYLWDSAMTEDKWYRWDLDVNTKRVMRGQETLKFIDSVTTTPTAAAINRLVALRILVVG